MFDEKLADAAELLDVTHGDVLLQKSIAPTTQHFAFQVWEGDVLGKHSANTPDVPIAPFEQGYRFGNFSNYRWRTYAMLANDKGRWILTADRTDIRNMLVESIILKSVVPVVLALPVSGLLIWLIVGYGLSPLRRLAGRLRDKRADDLSLLPDSNQPRELQQVITSVNGLLQRLDTSFRRERRFAADAAHELRTPISALRVHLHNLVRELPGEYQSLHELEAAILRMHNVVEQILALHRSSSEEILTRFEPIDLHVLVREYLARKYSQFEARDQDVELQGDAAFLTGDAFALETLLKNLLDNACKYTPIGGAIRVLLSTVKGRILLEVHDSGPGIPAEQYQRVFDRFYRLDGDQHASGVPGCGLGLSIVEHIAALHHATVTLGKSMFDSGLAVYVSFPASSVPAVHTVKTTVEDKA